MQVKYSNHTQAVKGAVTLTLGNVTFVCESAAHAAELANYINRCESVGGHKGLQQANPQRNKQTRSATTCAVIQPRS